MAAPPVGLVPRLVFGLPGSPRGDCLQYGDDGGVIHVAGAAVVVASADPRAAARIIPGTHGCEAVTALATAPGRRLLAVAERGEKALISVYDLQTLKRRKTLQAAEVGSQEYMSLSFSPDGKQLLAQGGGPEWNLLLFAWERGKVTASVRATNAQGAPLVKCALSFGDGGLATTLGPGVLRIFRVLEGSLKALPIGNAKREALPYSCQAWLPLAPGGGGNAATGEGGGGSGPAGAGAGGGSDHSRQILGTAEGEILLLEGTELKATLSCDASGRGITALAAYGRGFAVGRDGGAVTLFERDDREGWRVSRTLVVPDHPLPVGVFAVAPNEEQLALLLEGGPMFTLGVGGSDLPKPDDEAFDRLGPGAHCGPVTGVDVCVRRPIIASASADRHVRLWNYIDRTCELDRPFPEEALCVSCHPSGTLLLVGCADRLRLVAVLLDDLRTVREIAIRGCRDVAFAHGGHLFAAANGASVSVHSTWTAETVGNLRGHNGKVRALCWSHDDTRLVTAGADGAVYEWRVADLKRERESVSKGVVYSAAAPSPDGRSLVAAGNDKRIRELEDTGTGVQPVREVDAGCIITALALPQGGRVLFAGTEAGGVRGYRFPLTGEYYEVKLHAAPVTRLALSWDDALLVSGGSDGAVAVSDVRDRDLAKGPSRRDADRLPWAEEVLVPRSELDERRARVAELEARVAELGASAEYQLRLRELAAQERLREATDRAAAEREADRAKFEALLTEKNEQELEYEERLKGSEARAAAQLAALDAQYQARLMTEVERYGTLAAEKEALSARWDEQNALLVESHERVVAELTEEYEFKLAEEALAHEALRREKEDLDREAAEVRRQVEEDADRELEEARGRGETRLAAERETALRLKGENGILRKKFQALARELEEQRGAAAAAAQQRAELHATIKSLERDAAGLRREIRERDDALGDKEGRIHELKRKNQELEKFKFVLDFKIKELKRQARGGP